MNGRVHFKISQNFHCTVADIELTPEVNTVFNRSYREFSGVGVYVYMRELALYQRSSSYWHCCCMLYMHDSRRDSALLLSLCHVIQFPVITTHDVLLRHNLRRYLAFYTASVALSRSTLAREACNLQVRSTNWSRIGNSARQHIDICAARCIKLA